MSDHAKLVELIGAIEAKGWGWLTRSAMPGSPFDRMAQDKYFGCVAIWNDGEMERRFSAWGPSSDEALQTAYTEALRSLN